MNVTPHSLEAERAVLGAILVDNDRFDDVADALTSADYFRVEHGMVFDAIRDLAEHGSAIDFLTVRERLKAKGQLDAVTPAYLAGLTDGVPRSTNVEHYAQIVRDKSHLRRLRHAANKILADTTDETREPRELIDRAEQEIYKLSQQHVRGDFVDAEQLVRDGFNAVQQILENKGGATGIPTGFMDIDAMTRGYQPSTLNVLAARPSMGKTALVLNIAYQVAVADLHVGFFSLEMSREELFIRLLSSVARINSHRLQSGHVNQTDYGRMSDAMGKIAASYLHIDDTPTMGLMDVRGKARRLKARSGLDLVIIDYLQLMELPAGENRNVQIGEVTRGLKRLARELKVPIVVLSQLTRETERRGDKRPVLSDLRDSGAIEQDADTVMFIHRPEYYQQTPDNAGLAEIIIAKQRNGPTGTVHLCFAKESTRFDNWSARA